MKIHRSRAAAAASCWALSMYYASVNFAEWSSSISKRPDLLQMVYLGERVPLNAVNGPVLVHYLLT
jgi:hypothetical protein